MKKPKLYLLIRSYVETAHVDMWLIRKDGAAHSWVLWGQPFPNVAESLAEALGLPVEREERPYKCVPMPLPAGTPVVLAKPTPGDLFTQGQD